VNGVFLLGNVNKGQDDSQQLWEVENIMHDKSRESRKLYSNGAKTGWLEF